MVIGRIERYSVLKTVFKSSDEVTVTILLKDVKVQKNQTKIYLNHTWIKLTNQLYDMNLKEGSIIDFRCKVEQYKKKTYKRGVYKNKYSLKGVHTIHLIKNGFGTSLYNFLSKLGIYDHNVLKIY